MISSNTSAEVFRKLREDEDNRVCFDCNNVDITHASVNLGILLCSTCASLHRALGINISCVKSLKDPWTTRHLKLMTAGGNSSLKAFFALYSIPCNSRNEFKYRTVACEYYREMLKMIAEGASLMMVTPSEEEGILMMDEYRPPSPIKRAETSNSYRNSLEICEKTIEEIKESGTVLGLKKMTSDVFGFMSKGLSWGAERSKEGLEWSASQGKTLIKSLTMKDNIVNEANKMYEKIQGSINFSAIKQDTLNMLRELESKEKDPVNDSNI